MRTHFFVKTVWNNSSFAVEWQGGEPSQKVLEEILRKARLSFGSAAKDAEDDGCEIMGQHNFFAYNSITGRRVECGKDLEEVLVWKNGKMSNDAKCDPSLATKSDNNDQIILLSIACGRLLGGGSWFSSNSNSSSSNSSSSKKQQASVKKNNSSKKKSNAVSPMNSPVSAAAVENRRKTISTPGTVMTVMQRSKSRYRMVKRRNADGSPDDGEDGTDIINEDENNNGNRVVEMVDNEEGYDSDNAVFAMTRPKRTGSVVEKIRRFSIRVQPTQKRKHRPLHELLWTRSRIERGGEWADLLKRASKAYKKQAAAAATDVSFLWRQTGLVLGHEVLGKHTGSGTLLLKEPVLYMSSTLADFITEREIIWGDVYPFLREIGNRLGGLSYSLVDLCMGREHIAAAGLSFGSTLSEIPRPELAAKVLDRCRDKGFGIKFLLLRGEQCYGLGPVVPYFMTVEVFRLIRSSAGAVSSPTTVSSGTSSKTAWATRRRSSFFGAATAAASAAAAGGNNGDGSNGEVDDAQYTTAEKESRAKDVAALDRWYLEDTNTGRMVLQQPQHLNRAEDLNLVSADNYRKDLERIERVIRYALPDVMEQLFLTPSEYDAIRGITDENSMEDVDAGSTVAVFRTLTGLNAAGGEYAPWFVDIIHRTSLSVSHRKRDELVESRLADEKRRIKNRIHNPDTRTSPELSPKALLLSSSSLTPPTASTAASRCFLYEIPFDGLIPRGNTVVFDPEAHATYFRQMCDELCRSLATKTIQAFESCNFSTSHINAIESASHLLCCASSPFHHDGTVDNVLNSITSLIFHPEASDNGNNNTVTCIVGPQGSGKTAFTCALVEHIRVTKLAAQTPSPLTALAVRLLGSTPKSRVFRELIQSLNDQLKRIRKLQQKLYERQLHQYQSPNNSRPSSAPSPMAVPPLRLSSTSSFLREDPSVTALEAFAAPDSIPTPMPHAQVISEFRSMLTMTKQDWLSKSAAAAAPLLGEAPLVILVLDGIDQMQLMSILPERATGGAVKLVVSCCDENVAVAKEWETVAVPSAFNGGSMSVLMEAFLSANNRKITSEQREALNALLTNRNKSNNDNNNTGDGEDNDNNAITPLHVSLIYHLFIARSWNSYNHSAWKADMSRWGNPPSISSIVNAFLDSLERELGPSLVQWCVGCIAASMHGLSDTEIQDLASCNEDVMKEVYDRKIPAIRRIPAFAWFRLKDQLRDLCVETAARSPSLIQFAHKQVQEAVCSRYVTPMMRRTMAMYFLGKLPDESVYQEGLVIRQKLILGKGGVYNARQLEEVPHQLVLNGGSLFSAESQGNKIKAENYQWEAKDMLFFWLSNIRVVIAFRRYQELPRVDQFYRLEWLISLMGPQKVAEIAKRVYDSAIHYLDEDHKEGNLEVATGNEADDDDDIDVEEAACFLEETPGGRDLATALWDKLLFLTKANLPPSDMKEERCCFLMEQCAQSYSNNRQYDRAASLLLHTVDCHKRFLDPDNPVTAKALTKLGLAMIQISSNHGDQALQHMAKGLTMFERLKLPLEAADAHYAIGNVLLCLEKFSDAAASYQRALDIRFANLGIWNLQTSAVLNSLGSALMQQGKMDDAMKMFERSLSIQTRLLGDCHHLIACTLSRIGLCMKNQGKYDEALERYTKAMDMYAKFIGTRSHPASIAILNSMGVVLKDQGRFADAIAKFEELDKMRSKVYQDEHDTANVLLELGTMLGVVGRYEEAIDKLQQVVTIRRKILGQGNMLTVQAMLEVVKLLERQGKIKEAMENCQTVKTICIDEEDDGENTCSPIAASVWEVLANLYAHQNKFDEAIKSLDKAVAIHAKLLGKKHPAIIKCINTIGCIMIKKSKLDEAKSYFDKAMKISRKTLGPDHAINAEILINQAKLHRKQKQLIESQQCLEQAIAIRTKTLGSEHVDTCRAMVELGNIHYEQGNAAEALTNFVGAGEVFAVVLGKCNLETAAVYQRIGSIQQQSGQYADAIVTYQEVLAARLKLLGKEHPRTAETLHSMGSVFYLQNEFDEATQKFEQAAMVRMKAFGEKHPLTLESIVGLGNSMLNEERFDEARACHERALAILEAQKKENEEHSSNPLYCDILFNLASNLEHCGQMQQALDKYEETLETMTRILGKDHPNVADTLHNMASIHMENGKKQLALEEFNQALEIRVNSLGKKHSSTAATLYSIGHLLDQCGKIDEAIEYYQQALAIQKATLGKGHADTSLTMYGLGNLLQQKGKYLQAEHQFSHLVTAPAVVASLAAGSPRSFNSNSRSNSGADKGKKNKDNSSSSNNKNSNNNGANSPGKLRGRKSSVVVESFGPMTS